MATPDALYKYCSIAEAQQILESRRLRWCATHLLENPFELTHATTLSFNHEQLLYAVVKTAAGLVFAKEPPGGGAPLMVAIRRWRDEERFGSVEEAEEVLQELMGQLVEQRKEVLKQILSDWQGLQRKLRVCQLTGKPDNLYAWQELADRHRGVILRFGRDTNDYFAQSDAVTYSEQRPEITSLKEQLDVILTNDKFSAQKHFIEKMFIKPAALKYQQEVRCVTQQDETTAPIQDDPSTWFVDREFDDGVLTAVHFGLATSTPDKQRLWDFVKGHYSQVKFFETRLFPGKYAMDVQRLAEKPQ